MTRTCEERRERGMFDKGAYNKGAAKRGAQANGEGGINKKKRGKRYK